MAEPVSADLLRSKVALPEVDPNINVPKAVRDAALRSTAIQQALTGASEKPVITSTPDPQTIPPQDQASSPPPESAPQPPSPAGEPSPPAEPEETWQNRYGSMLGRYNSLRGEMQQMAEQLQRLQNENAIMRQNPPRTGSDGVNLLTEQEMADYGPEFIDVVRRAAREEAAPLHAEIQNLRGQLGMVQQETSNAFLTRMNATISGMVPDWQNINRHPQFIEWVGLPETYSGVIRQQLMQEAWNNGDAHRVAAFFRAFLAEVAAVDPQRAGTHAQPALPSPYPAQQPGNGAVPLGTRLSLDSLAAPGRGHAGTQAPADKPVYTAQDITRFYTEVAAGKWRTRDQERAAIDADIIAAQKEGRIIPDQRTIRPTERNGHW